MCLIFIGKNLIKHQLFLVKRQVWHILHHVMWETNQDSKCCLWNPRDHFKCLFGRWGSWRVYNLAKHRACATTFSRKTIQLAQFYFDQKVSKKIKKIVFWHCLIWAKLRELWHYLLLLSSGRNMKKSIQK